MKKLTSKQKEILAQVISKCFGTDRWVIHAFDKFDNGIAEGVIGHKVNVNDLEHIKGMIDDDIKDLLEKKSSTNELDDLNPMELMDIFSKKGSSKSNEILDQLRSLIKQSKRKEHTDPQVPLVQEAPKAKYKMSLKDLHNLVKVLPPKKVKVKGVTFDIKELYTTLYNADLPHELELNNVKMTKDDIFKALKVDLKTNK